MSEENRPVLKAKKASSKDDSSQEQSKQNDTPVKKKESGSKSNANEDVRTRLKNAYEDIISALDQWDQKNDSSKEASKLRETLLAMHRVVSRIEIQMAYAERDNQAHKPIPTPKHRASKKTKQD